MRLIEPTQISQFTIICGSDCGHQISSDISVVLLGLLVIFLKINNKARQSWH